MRPKKKTLKAIQKTIMITAVGLGFATSKAPGLKSTANIATTMAGDPSRIAIVRRLFKSVADVRRVRTCH